MSDLLILPFDHRSSFAKLIGAKYPVTAAEKKKIETLKMIVFNGFLKVQEKYNGTAILVDEEFGQPVIKKAKERDVKVAMPTEKSGQQVFDFEFGKDYKAHIQKFNPSYVKTLVRYDPSADNEVQLKRLKQLANFCKRERFPFLFELLLGDKLSPKNMKTAIKQIQDYGILPQVWKLEPVTTKRAWKQVEAVIHEKNPKGKLILLGRAAPLKVAREWIKTAAEADVNGFAVGRTVFHAPLTKYVKGKATRKEAADMIAKRYEDLVKVWVSNRKE